MHHNNNIYSLGSGTVLFFNPIHKDLFYLKTFVIDKEMKFFKILLKIFLFKYINNFTLRIFINLAVFFKKLYLNGEKLTSVSFPNILRLRITRFRSKVLFFIKIRFVLVFKQFS